MWYNSSWPYRVKITVPSSQVPANATNFPVFLDLSLLPPAFHEHVKSDGGDIRITASDGTTELAREVVYYEPSTDKGEVHFKVPTLSSSVDNEFYIYYGNSSATNHSDSGTYGAYNVWTVFTGVYHLNETNNTTSNGYKNSKANSGHGTGTSMGLTTLDGKVGKTAAFDGVDDRIQTSSVNSMANTSSSASAWIYMGSATGKGTFFKIGTGANGWGMGVGLTTFDDVGNKLIMIFEGVRWIVTTGTLSVGWHKVTMVLAASGVPSAYIDGVLVAAYSGTNSNSPTTQTQIGATGASSRYFAGNVEEVRHTNTVLSANWILTEYRNQNSPVTFTTFGVQEWLDPDAPQVPIDGSPEPEYLDIPEYTVELWSSTGIYMADVSNILVAGINIQMPLNDVEQVSFSLDLAEFERKCARINETPRNILDPYRTDVKIKRNGAYLLGTQVVQAQINLNNQSANTIEVRCTGYLNLFKDRYITPGLAPSNNATLYANKTYAQIAQRLIVDTQTQTNGNFGVTIGQDTASPTQDHTRTRQYDYDNQNVKDGILNLTKLEADNFDFKFTWDRQFECYDRLGSDKPDIELVYPQNIVSMTVLRDATTLANKITGIGSGMGDERVIDTQTDSISTLAYNVREKIELFNTVQTQSVLEDNVTGLLPLYSDLYEVPSVNVTNGAIVPGDTVVGDAVLVRVEGSTFVESINDLYRIIGMTIQVTNNMEENISLKLVKWT